MVILVFMKGNLVEVINLMFDFCENYNIFCFIVIYLVVLKDIIMFWLIFIVVYMLDDVNYIIEIFKKLKDKFDVGVYKVDELVVVEVDRKK